VALRRPAGLVLLLLGLLAPASATAGSLDGTVVRVVDGDTIYVRLTDRLEKIRYIGVDAPEVHHPFKGEKPGGREAAAVNRGSSMVVRAAARREAGAPPSEARPYFVDTSASSSTCARGTDTGASSRTCGRATRW